MTPSSMRSNEQGTRSGHCRLEMLKPELPSTPGSVRRSNTRFAAASWSCFAVGGHARSGCKRRGYQVRIPLLDLPLCVLRVCSLQRDAPPTSLRSRTAHSQRHSPYAEPSAERVAQRYITTGLWLLINAGTDGLRPNEVGASCSGPVEEPEPEPEELHVLHDDAVPARVDEAMRTGTSARDLQAAATVLDRGKCRRRVGASRSAAQSQPRRGTRKRRRCSQCLSPMYPSHCCIMWDALTWNRSDDEWANQPVPTQQP